VCLIAEHEDFSGTDTETLVSVLFCFNLHPYYSSLTTHREKDILLIAKICCWKVCAS